MFFSSWSEIFRIIVMGVAVYLALLIILRTSGKRTLTKMNAFDFIVTVALGSTVATTLLNRDITWAEGVTALGILVLLQYAVTFTSTRMQAVKQLVKSEPTLLFFQGKMIDTALLDQRLHEEEVRAAIRAEGFSQLNRVEAVILETDGTFSVLPVRDKVADSAVQDVKNYPPGDPRAPTDIQSNPGMTESGGSQ